jgi:hypothetical protein
MKALKFTLATALIGGMMMVASCGKYEEGPGFSLRTKKARLAGEWDFVEYVDGDGTVTADNDDDYVTFEKDGTYKYTDGNTSINGTWEFVDDKEKIRVTYTSGNLSVSNDAIIVRLTNKELWMKDSDGDMTKLEAK